ncbi:MAG: hypothetical protein ACPGN3_08780 [Opitutales bacterium]
MKTPPRLDSLTMEIVRGRNAWLALGLIGIAGCVPVLNFVVFGYILEVMGKYQRTGQIAFEKPADWTALVRESLIVGVAFLAYAGVPWFCGGILEEIIDQLSAMAVVPIGSLCVSTGGIIGLGLFGAAFITYIRSGSWEPLLQVREIAQLALSMASAVWLPVVLIFGFTAITEPFYGLGLAIGLFFYCFYLGEISRRLSQS